MTEFMLKMEFWPSFQLFKLVMWLQSYFGIIKVRRRSKWSDTKVDVNPYLIVVGVPWGENRFFIFRLSLACLVRVKRESQSKFLF